MPGPSNAKKTPTTQPTPSARGAGHSRDPQGANALDRRPSQVDEDEEDAGARSPYEPGPSDDEDEDDEEDEDPDASNPLSSFPLTHEITLKDHTKVVSALALDPSGARIASGSHDYDCKLWDFGGMTAALKPFKSWEPAGSYYVSTSRQLFIHRRHCV